MKKFKIAVIGGGPVGLYTSIILANKGHKITVFEKNTWPKDKVCGQGIMPSGVELLEEIGIDCSVHGHNFQGIKYIDHNNQLSGKLKTKAFGIRRINLSKALYKAASKLENISLTQNQRINNLEQLTDFDYIFACDGLHSTMRELTNNKISRKPPYRMGARLHCQIKPWSDNVEVYWNKGVEAYVTAVDSSLIEIAFLWYQDLFSIGPSPKEKLLNQFPILKNKIQNASFQNDFKAYGPFTHHSRKIQKNNIFFLGDAYKFLDGITGEGLSLGFKSSKLLADNLEKPLWLCKFKIILLYSNYQLWVYLALKLSRFPRLRGAIFSILKRYPFIFSNVLKINDLNLK